MNGNLFFSEILFAIIIAIALLVFWQLKVSKDGVLRKIFLWYFAIEIYMFTFSGIYWHFADNGNDFMPIYIFRLLILVPKAVIKLVLLWWLVKQNRKQKTN